MLQILSTAVLRVTFSGPRKKNHEGPKTDLSYSNKLLFQQLQSHFNQRQEFHVYTLLSRQQVLEPREVRGGDEMRLNYLSEKLGVKLIGRKGLGPTADSVIASIKAERANHKSASTSLTVKSGISKPKSATSKQKLVRKAKVMRFNNESTPPKLGGGAMVVANGIGSLSSPNQNLGSKIVGNSSSSAPSVNTLVGGLHGSLSPPSLNMTNGKMAEQM